MRSLGIVLLLCAGLPPTAASAKRRDARARRVSDAQMLRLMRSALAPKATLLGIARRIDPRLRRVDAAALPFVEEPIDEVHPGLSTPWDLPQAEYPRRAVLRWPIRAFGKDAELRLVAPLAALDPAKRATLSRSPTQNLILMVTASRRGGELPLGRVARLAAKLGSAVFASGRLGVCQPQRQWCHTRRYAVPGRSTGRQQLMLELATPSSGVGGFKLVAGNR